MSTSICDGVQTRFEPWLIEPRVTRLKLAPPKNDVGLGGWSFLQSLSNTTQIENEKVYIHPLVRKSASMLSEKSLEMCTESLGSETGSDISENGDELISILDTLEKSPKIPCFILRKRLTHVGNFPPPLTTIRGSSTKVKSQRENGRLVIKAVRVVGTHQSCFKAERKDGRLKLHYLLKTSYCSSISRDDDDDVEELYDDVDDHDGDDHDGDYDDDDDEFDYDDGKYEEDMEGNNENVEGKVGNCSRPRMCKEEHGDRRSKEMLNWEPFWVATS